MPHRLRKVRKMRASRTHGYGQIGQHRKSSQKGRRKVGRHKHGWSYVLRYEPDYFKKVRFISPRGGEEPSILNLKQLEEIAFKLRPKKRTSKTKVFVDLEQMGYTKLLGGGKITLPVSVKVPSCSEMALRKIEEAGGEVLKEGAQV